MLIDTRKKARNTKELEKGKEREINQCNCEKKGILAGEGNMFDEKGIYIASRQKKCQEVVRIRRHKDK